MCSPRYFVDNHSVDRNKEQQQSSLRPRKASVLVVGDTGAAEAAPFFSVLERERNSGERVVLSFIGRIQRHAGVEEQTTKRV